MIIFGLNLYKYIIQIYNTSIIGLLANTFFSICVSVAFPPTVAKYLITYLADTVFPAPLSPDIIILWSRNSLSNFV